VVEVLDPEFVARDAIRHWCWLPELADFAVQRHGFGDSNGGFGVTYPGDLDEYDLVVRGDSIPAGFVRAYGFWGPPDGYEVLVPEPTYLEILASELATAGHAAEAALVRSLAEKQKRPND
jgi:hypothetical protein